MMKNKISPFTSFMLKMMILNGKKVRKHLDETTKDPKKYQEELLMHILDNAKNTELERQYNLKDIHSVKEFQDRFPITDYDFYSAYIEKMVKGRKNVLTNRKIVHFNITSGTLGVPKKIPVTEEHVSLFSTYNSKYLNATVDEAIGDKWAKHRGFSLSEGSYETLSSGVTMGSASSLHTARMQRMIPFLKIDTMDLMVTSPVEARQPKDLGTYTRYLHARFALMSDDIAYGNVTFSSYLLEIMRYIEDKWKMITDDIEKGVISNEVEIPAEIKKSVLKKIKPMPYRAKQLRQIFEKGFDLEPLFPYIWPNLKFFMCVGSAGFEIYTEKLKERYFGNRIHILYLGLSASEGLFSIPLKLDDPNAVFVPNATFMEFIPLKDGERDLSSGIRLLHELETGKQYELVISNVSGLLRYQMKDVIEVTGFYHKTPIMKFVKRAGFAINMYAEKTSEAVLQYVADKTSEKYGLDLYDYCVCPYQGVHGGRYIFMFEFRNSPKAKGLKHKIRDTAEEILREVNPIYDEIRKDGTMQKLVAKILQEETFLLYRDLMIMKGKPAAQLKPVHVTVNPFQQNFFLGLQDHEMDVED